MTVVLGLDLSMGCPGFAVILVDNKQPVLVKTVHVKTDAKLSHGERLMQIERVLIDLIKEFGHFDLIAREKGFSMHARTTQVLFKVVGISDLTLAKDGYKAVSEYAPTTVKKTITGNGKASKKEVETAVRALLKLEDGFTFESDDESDACAVALTCLKQGGLI